MHSCFPSPETSVRFDAIPSHTFPHLDNHLLPRFLALTHSLTRVVFEEDTVHYPSKLVVHARVREIKEVRVGLIACAGAGL